MLALLFITGGGWRPVIAERDGKFVRYALADDAILDLIASVHRVAERQCVEVSRIVSEYFDARDAMEPNSRAELVARLAELDPAQQIVAYCRGPWCVLSFEAVARLRALGFDARRLEAGYPEWRAAGMPVA